MFCRSTILLSFCEKPRPTPPTSKPFVSIAINKKVKFDGARCPFSTFLRLQGDQHCACAQKGVIFHFFSRAFKQKKIKALRPKMTKIASRGSCLRLPLTIFRALHLRRWSSSTLNMRAVHWNRIFRSHCSKPHSKLFICIISKNLRRIRK